MMMLGCISAAAVFAAAFAVDLKSGFESDPFDGGAIMVDDLDSSSLSFTLNKVPLEGDVVADCLMRFTATDDDSVPELPNDAKFALWLYGSGAVTNLRVTAAGNATRTAATYVATNYCLNVSSDALLGGEWCQVTVRAIPNITTQRDENTLMGFVVFINGKPAACADPDYRSRFFSSPAEAFYQDSPFSEVAEALIDLKMLFPSIQRPHYSQASGRLKALDFTGNVGVDAFSIGYQSANSELGVLPVPVADDVVPHLGRTLYASEEAAEKAAGAKAVEWPEDADLSESVKTPENKARYSGLFDVTSSGRTVFAVMKSEGDEVEAVKAQLTEGTQEILGGGGSVEVSAVPGLYYGVSTGETLDAMEVKSWTIATCDKVEVAIPAKGENQTSGFYRLEASPSK